jgi:hypothetical protein
MNCVLIRSTAQAPDGSADQTLCSNLVLAGSIAFHLAILKHPGCPQSCPQNPTRLDFLIRFSQTLLPNWV